MKRRSSKLFVLISVFTLFLALGLTACVKNFEKGPPTKRPILTKPHPEDDVPLVWTYIETLKTEELKPEIPACPDDFTYDGPCGYLNHTCHLGNNIHKCQPENGLLTFKGVIEDENGEPLGGAYIYGGNGYPGYTNLKSTFSREDGTFVIHYPKSCLKVFFAQKDGYQSDNGYYVNSQIVECQFAKWGNQEIKIKLKKLARSVSPDRELSGLEGKCIITGRVLDTNNQPLNQVKVVSKNEETLTDETGHYSLLYDGPCAETCSGYKEGYASPNPRFRGHSHVSCINGRPGDLILQKVQD